jgi:transmembrane 9 superfamily protein 2/4
LHVQGKDLNNLFGKISLVFLLFSVIFGIFFILNLVLWANGSSAAIPFTTFIALLALWFCVSTPLVFVGAYLGFKRPVR